MSQFPMINAFFPHCTHAKWQTMGLKMPWQHNVDGKYGGHTRSILGFDLVLLKNNSTYVLLQTLIKAQ